MGKIIASMYEITRELGSGGGGVVYLGYHTRLDKPVVLKADKRSLSASPARLRQEVDLLKNLHHPYLPQVYDFVQEDGAVYTVMDYIEGESLDKPLARGERFEQKQVVEWACQLLEALCYLHSQGEHGILHADIKPANIMLTSRNEIRLIDFNIALALGEDGAVRMGYSAGYASPEHYGLDYSGTHTTTIGRGGTTSSQRGAPRGGTAAAPGAAAAAGTDGTEILRDGAEPASRSAGVSASKSNSGHGVLLDVRSDIYSLGAALYHLFTGRRPEVDASQVRPASDLHTISPQIAAIIDKSMNPNPNLRYQTAAEMLRAFERLHENDPRARRHRRAGAAAAAITLLVALLGSGMVYVGQRQRTRCLELERLAAESRDALLNGDTDGAVSLALRAMPDAGGIYNPPFRLPSAQLALSNALGVYDLHGDYSPVDAVPLPSEPVKLRLSPDGSTGAWLVRDGNAWRVQVYDTESGRILAEPEAEPSPLSDMQFLEDGRLLFAGIDGLTALDTASGKVLWTTGRRATGIATGQRIAATVFQDEGQAYFFDIETGAEAREPLSFDGKRMRVPSGLGGGEFGQKTGVFALDAEGNRLAVSFDDGSVTIFHLQDSRETVSLPPSAYTHFDGCFCGSYFALSRCRSGTADTLLEIYDFSTPDIELAFGPLTGENGPAYLYNVATDGSVFYISNLKQLARVDMEAQTSDLLVNYEAAGDTIAGFSQSENRVLVWTGAGRYELYNEHGQRLAEGMADDAGDLVERAAIAGEYLIAANNKQPVLWVKRMDDHREALALSYDSSYFHQEARLRADRAAAVLFSYEGFRVTQADGSVAAQRDWDPDTTYDPQFRRPGDTDFQGGEVTEELLEMRFLDGHIEGYSAEDGRELYRVEGDAPDRFHSVNRFLTDKYQILSVNHGAPEIYDASGNQLLKRLEDKTHLAYARQIGENLILQFDASEGRQQEMYGILLDSSLSEIARFPQLSDILPDGSLLFDDGLGNLRLSRIYSIEDLIAIAEKEGGGNL